MDALDADAASTERRAQRPGSMKAPIATKMTQPGSLPRRVRALSAWDEKVLAAVTTWRTEGVPNFNILPYEFGAGGEISRSLQKLQRRGLVVIVRKHRGVTWWKAQRPNGPDQRRDE